MFCANCVNKNIKGILKLKNHNEMYYHDQKIEDVFGSLVTSSQGITEQDAAKRLVTYGPNELIEDRQTSRFEMLISQFKGFLIIILIAAAVVSALLGEIADSIIILLIVILSGVLGFFQDYRAQKAIEALKKMAAPTATVLRSANKSVIPASGVVPGDIILLQTGDGIPADSRLIESINLQVDEASLTGESTPVPKITDIISREALVADRKNMVYMGTSVTYGRGKAVVTATGMKTELGSIAGMLEKIEREKTPLQFDLDRLGVWIGIITMIVVAFVSILGVMSGFDIIDMFIWGVALAVAAIPEALPAVVTVCLALGVRRMVKRHALVRKLPSVETLGATTVICSDKTGTLTRDEMTVRNIYIEGRMLDVTGSGYEPVGDFMIGDIKINPEEEDFKAPGNMLLICALCNDSELVNEKSTWHIKGDPTEGALAVLAQKGGIRKHEVEKMYRRIDEIPFSSERKMMTTIYSMPGGVFAYSKGAPEVILDSCSSIYQNGSVVELKVDEKVQIIEVVKTMASRAQRVLAFSQKPLKDSYPVNDVEKEMVFIGLAGMIDPPREEVKTAIATCKRAGIKTVMITGDHQLTGCTVAKELGLFGKGEMTLTGAKLDTMDDNDLERIVENVSVYARVTPAHKMRIIDALKKKGHVVAMTGDGVNDAPALKSADIGIAMGITGTAVSKEASDMILTDDNFTSIVAAIEEGRNIFKNIRNFVQYGIGCHIGEVLIVLIAMLTWQEIPLIAIQILWINLITDGLPPIALSVEPPDKSLMMKAPRRPDEGIITKRVLVYGLAIGILIALQALFLFRWSLDGSGLLKARTMVFTLIVISMMFNAFNWRSERLSIFEIGIFSNRTLLYAVGSTILLQLLVIYAPILNGPFNTVPLGLMDWVIIILLASTTLIFVEVSKFFEAK
ncbi:MAG: calcium-transporting P-type ATPase, PMR1-type [Candidatus Methanoperedens sp.]|nr:calcium-transporting P-type ATPase, PMR1-type [Candidatus Methanoperedens sp.]